MNTQAELNKQSILELEKEKAELQSIISKQDIELARVSNAIAEKCTALRDLLDQIYALEIDRALKRSMTGTCLSLIETEAIEKRLNMALTESDSLFLSRLQKKHQNLNQRELQICLLIKLDYDINEIARFVHLSARGMESLRFKMHKKLGLGKHQSIKAYFSDFMIN